MNEPIKPAALPKESKWFLLVPVIFGVALLNMGGWLWGREHYQFFPFVILGFAALAYHRLDRIAWVVSSRVTMRTLILGFVCSGLFALSVWTSSPWIGTLAAIVFAWMLVWIIGGQRVANELRGPFALLFLILPLPLDLDLLLIVELQSVASSAASMLLDFFTIIHTNHGVAISTVDGEFMVEEACSGIHSLFSCLTVMMFWVVFHRYGLFRIILTFLHTVVWVVLANAIRVFALVYADNRMDLDLTEGWRHELLGVATYAIAIGLALSMDQWLRFFVKVREYAPSNRLSGDATWLGRLNFFFNSPLLADQASIRIAKGSLACVFIPLALISFVSAVMPSSTSAGDGGQPNALVETFEIDTFQPYFPEKVMGYELESLDSVNRESGDVFGSHSLVGTYSGNGQTVLFSVDGFYNDWHDLTICYRGLGWEIESIENRSPGGGVAGNTAMLLFRDGDQQSYCVYSCHETDGDFVRPGFSGDTAFRSLVRRVTKSTGLLVDQREDVVPPVLQFQLYVFSDVELLDEELERLDRVFVQVRESLRTGLNSPDTNALLEVEGGQE